jgi:hypothetical protein
MIIIGGCLFIQLHGKGKRSAEILVAKMAVITKSTKRCIRKRWFFNAEKNGTR